VNFAVCYRPCSSEFIWGMFSMIRPQVLAAVILGLTFAAGGPVLAASEAECNESFNSCRNKCPTNPKDERDKCVWQCTLKLMACR